jgi:hypothetical protein
VENGGRLLSEKIFFRKNILKGAPKKNLPRAPANLSAALKEGKLSMLFSELGMRAEFTSLKFLQDVISKLLFHAQATNG